MCMSIVIVYLLGQRETWLAEANATITCTAFCLVLPALYRVSGLCVVLGENAKCWKCKVVVVLLGLCIWWVLFAEQLAERLPKKRHCERESTLLYCYYGTSRICHYVQLSLKATPGYECMPAIRFSILNSWQNEWNVWPSRPDKMDIEDM